MSETQYAQERLAATHAALRKAASLSPNPPQEIALIAVSKTQSAEKIQPYLAAGHSGFGENYVQEAQGKWPALVAQYPHTELHLIGHLQSNKAEEAVRLFTCIQSVDRASVITALAKAEAKIGLKRKYFLQVNIGEEAQKHGCSCAEVAPLLVQARDAGLNIMGLMAIPPADKEPAPYFALLAKLAGEQGLNALSMGMSGDYETAAMLGATHVRVGSALFGARN
jgi:PLP dependent protein